jgi:hypothetical protein
MKFIGAQLSVGEIGVGSLVNPPWRNDVKLSSSRRPDHSHGPSADYDRPVLFSVKGRFWRRADIVHDSIGQHAKDNIVVLLTIQRAYLFRALKRRDCGAS